MSDSGFIAFLEVRGIQDYIFGSNRLRENIGASHLVALATAEDGWAGACASSHGAEDIYLEGAGNFAARFPTRAQAHDFVRKLSRELLEKAPGIALVAVVEPLNNDFGAVQRRALAALEVAKRQHPAREALAGFSVTRECDTTGAPAVTFKGRSRDENEPSLALSAKSVACWEMQSAARERLEALVPPPCGFAYAEDLDQLGKDVGKESYIAVVHADGNAIGKRFTQWVEQGKAPRELSLAVAAAARAALHKTLEFLANSIRDGIEITQEWGDQRLLRLPLHFRDDKRFLPIRPIVFGGDDLTFVCDGRLGLSLATFYLQAFSKATRDLPDGLGSATACAGVAIVKSGYPFSQAYLMAEELTVSAKRYHRSLKARMNQPAEVCCLDWQLAPQGLQGSLSATRQRDFAVTVERHDESNFTTGILTQRPLTVGATAQLTGHFRHWEFVRSAVNEFRAKSWSDRRGKVKALREALHGGGIGIRLYRQQYLDADPTQDGELLPDVFEMLKKSARESGWQRDLSEHHTQGTTLRSPYYDAIELLDLHLDLEIAAQQHYANPREAAHANNAHP